MYSVCYFLFIFLCVYIFRPEECARPFLLHPGLLNPDSELAYLRCVARILLLCLLPKKDAKSHTLRCCLTEVITTKGTVCIISQRSVLSQLQNIDYLKLDGPTVWSYHLSVVTQLW